MLFIRFFVDFYRPAGIVLALLLLNWVAYDLVSWLAMIYFFALTDCIWVMVLG